VIIDSHVNLHHEAFAEDVEDVIRRARAAGVMGMLTICDKLSSIEAIRQIAARHRFIWRSVGVHPHYAAQHAELRSCDLSLHLNDAKVVGIGECGLDFHYNHSSVEDQIRVFTAHVEAAQESGLPLIIHARDADELMQKTLEEAMGRKHFTPLLHCYTSGMALAQSVMEMGGYISFSGIASFKNAEDVRRVARQMPLDRVLVETDCPYLAPVPLRGQRCEPSHVLVVAEVLARLFDIPLDDFHALTTTNFFRAFRRADIGDTA